MPPTTTETHTFAPPIEDHHHEAGHRRERESVHPQAPRLHLPGAGIDVHGGLCGGAFGGTADGGGEGGGERVPDRRRQKLAEDGGGGGPVEMGSETMGEDASVPNLAAQSLHADIGAATPS